MKRAAIIACLAAPLALAACQGETEEAPDITEAIPLDPEPAEGTDSDGALNGANIGEIGLDGGEDTATGDTPALPDTMESGSNPPGMTAPPAGSKVQPAGQ